MRNLTFFLPLFILIIAGCTTQQSSTNTVKITPQTNGLSITNFTSNFNTLRVNENTNVRLDLKNVGDFEARNITTVFYGYGVLNILSQRNHTDSILPNRQDNQFWLLGMPTSLSNTGVATYSLGARMFYYYNFTGYQQVAFVPASYAGDIVSTSSGNSKGPVTVTINARNPVRTIDASTIFTITITLDNSDIGTVNYYECLINSACPKAGFINTLALIVPSDWTAYTDMSLWNNSPASDLTKYSINFAGLISKYNTDYNCGNIVKTSPYYETCSLLSTDINYLRMTRGTEARIVLQFTKPQVSDVSLDTIQVKGDYGYEVDTSDFGKTITITSRGD